MSQGLLCYVNMFTNKIALTVRSFFIATTIDPSLLECVNEIVHKAATFIILTLFTLNQLPTSQT